MEKFETHTGVGVLLRGNVDTDQIIPAEYLKRDAHRLRGRPFAAWRRDGAFVLNTPSTPTARSSWPDRTSGRGRAASTPSGPSWTTASAWSSARASPTSSAATAASRACSQQSCRRTTSSCCGSTSRTTRGRDHGRPRRADGDGGRDRGAVRHRRLHEVAPPRGARRHRPHDAPRGRGVALREPRPRTSP